MSYSKAKIDVFKNFFFESISGISPNSNIFSRLLPKHEKYNRKIFFKLSSRVESGEGRKGHTSDLILDPCELYTAAK